jgi:hypothetical protein
MEEITEQVRRIDAEAYNLYINAYANDRNNNMFDLYGNISKLSFETKQDEKRRDIIKDIAENTILRAKRLLREIKKASDAGKPLFSLDYKTVEKSVKLILSELDDINRITQTWPDSDPPLSPAGRRPG